MKAGDRFQLMVVSAPHEQPRPRWESASDPREFLCLNGLPPVRECHPRWVPIPWGLGDIRLVAVQCPPKIECSLDERAHLRLGKIALFLNGWKDALPVDPIHESAIPQGLHRQVADAETVSRGQDAGADAPGSHTPPEAIVRLVEEDQIAPPVADLDQFLNWPESWTAPHDPSMSGGGGRYGSRRSTPVSIQRWYCSAISRRSRQGRSPPCGRVPGWLAEAYRVGQQER